MQVVRILSVGKRERANHNEEKSLLEIFKSIMMRSAAIKNASLLE